MQNVRRAASRSPAGKTGPNAKSCAANCAACGLSSGAFPPCAPWVGMRCSPEDRHSGRRTSGQPCRAPRRPAHLCAALNNADTGAANSSCSIAPRSRPENCSDVIASKWSICPLASGIAEGGWGVRAAADPTGPTTDSLDTRRPASADLVAAAAGDAAFVARGNGVFPEVPGASRKGATWLSLAEGAFRPAAGESANSDGEPAVRDPCANSGWPPGGAVSDRRASTARRGNRRIKVPTSPVSCWPSAVKQIFVAGLVEGQLALEALQFAAIAVTSAEVSAIGRLRDQVARLSVVVPVERNPVSCDDSLGECDRLLDAWRVNEAALDIRVDRSTLPVFKSRMRVGGCGSC